MSDSIRQEVESAIDGFDEARDRVERRLRGLRLHFEERCRQRHPSPEAEDSMASLDSLQAELQNLSQMAGGIFVFLFRQVDRLTATAESQASTLRAWQQTAKGEVRTEYVFLSDGRAVRGVDELPEATVDDEERFVAKLSSHTETLLCSYSACFAHLKRLGLLDRLIMGLGRPFSLVMFRDSFVRKHVARDAASGFLDLLRAGARDSVLSEGTFRIEGVGTVGRCDDYVFFKPSEEVALALTHATASHELPPTTGVNVALPAPPARPEQ